MPLSALRRISSYEKRQSPATYLKDCREVCEQGIDACRSELAEAFRDPLQATQDIQTLKRAQRRLAHARKQLQKTGREVAPDNAEEHDNLKTAYASAYRDIARTIDARSPDAVKTAKDITQLSFTCHLLAVQLLAQLSAFLESPQDASPTFTSTLPDLQEDELTLMKDDGRSVQS